MAAYAALVSLMNTLDNVQHHRRFSNSLDNKQVESLREKLDFLLDFIETATSTHSQSDEEARLVLEREIACAAFAAEDVIESLIVHHIHHAAASIISLLDLETVIQDIDSVKEKVVIAKEQRGFKDHVQLQPTHPTSSSTAKISRMVGLDDELIRLLDELTGHHQSSLQIIPITGMGGIGKTTLARNAYENLLTVQHFDFRAWVTVSQQYTVRDIFSKLLSCESGEGDEYELGERLHKRLIGRRYLIILDDIWSLQAWHKLKRFFPDNYNRSRVVVTTRLSTIANHFSTSSFRLGFLDEETSWELFRENAFLGEGFPLELEELGKKIVHKCKGLPLLIVVVGALMRKSSVEYWGDILENINSISSIGEEESLDILSLSYSHLPAHLKPCFLYMGTLAEDAYISEYNLINLWVAEGFIKPCKTQSLEQVAEDYLKDLVDRNLILNGMSIGWCGIHDLLRELCLEKARKENFLCVLRVGDIRQGIDTESCFLYNQGRYRKDVESSYTVESAFVARSLASNGDSKLRMLRVLNAPNSYCDEDYLSKQLNLRYISIRNYNWNSVCLHSSISLLWNLQTLIIWAQKNIVAPREIWEMPQLRHVQVTNTIWLPDPPSLQDNDDDEFVVMQKLQTLWTVVNLSEEVCKRIPNVKTLSVEYDRDSTVKRIASSYDFGRIHKLQSLHCDFKVKPTRVDLLQNLTFPSSLQDLSLHGCYLHWEDLTMIGSLPHLRGLTLGNESVIGSEWNLVEGEFLSLRSLALISCNDLINWNADRSHFPLLENITLIGLPNLNEIPSGLGEIPTLAEIQLIDCSESSSISAVTILDQQESFGNESLRVTIGVFQGRQKLERFKEKIEQFNSNNLRLMSSNYQ